MKYLKFILIVLLLSSCISYEKKTLQMRTGVKYTESEQTKEWTNMWLASLKTSLSTGLGSSKLFIPPRSIK